VAPAQLVLAADQLQPSDPELFLDGATADLLWTTRSGFDIKEVNLARLEPATGEWRVQPVVPAPAAAVVFDAARGQCGEVWAMVQTLIGNPPTPHLQGVPLHVGRSNAVWRDVEIGLIGARDFALFTAKGTISLVASGVRPADSAFVMGRASRTECQP
jgi:hypothetical protein